MHEQRTAPDSSVPKSGKASAAAVFAPASASDNGDTASEDEGDDIDIEQRIASARRRLSPGDCFFCQHRAADVTENVSHMSSAHSFFIPDQDILLDLPGLIAYLGEKVAVGNLCLYCPNGGKEFGGLEPVRRHMIDKAHCKIAYNTEEDRAELADFYDFEGDTDQSDWEDVDDTWDSGPEVRDRFDRVSNTC